MIELTCQHCDHTWNYKGKQEYQTTCPRCAYKVRIKKKGRRSRGTQTPASTVKKEVKR